MKKLLAVVGIMLLPAIFSGCTGAQKGAAIGGSAGAATGAIIAATNPNAALSAGEAALVGLGAGGAGGALIGDAIEYKKEGKEGTPQPEVENLKKENELLTRRVNELEDQLRDQPPPGPTDKEIKGLEGEVGPDVTVGRSDKGITLTIVGDVLFDSGKETLRPDGKEALHQAAAVIREKYPNNELNIEGHTDSDPIRHSGYRSNWELSARRAMAVLNFLVKEEGFDEKLLSISGYADTKPVASNDTEEGKKKNRRAVIVILPKIQIERRRFQ